MAIPMVTHIAIEDHSAIGRHAAVHVRLVQYHRRPGAESRRRKGFAQCLRPKVSNNRPPRPNSESRSEFGECGPVADGRPFFRLRAAAGFFLLRFRFQVEEVREIAEVIRVGEIGLFRRTGARTGFSPKVAPSSAFTIAADLSRRAPRPSPHARRTRFSQPACRRVALRCK